VSAPYWITTAFTRQEKPHSSRRTPPAYDGDRSMISKWSSYPSFGDLGLQAMEVDGWCRFP
jgi:hypothetical protein